MATGGDGLDRVVQYLGEVQARLENSRPLALAIAVAVEDENREARLAGVDRFGAPLVPVKSQRGRSGSGPPLAPQGAASRVITGYRTRVEEVRPGTYRITASWPGLDWIVYHTEGAGRLPVRDIEGIREVAWARIAGEVRDFAEQVVKPTL